MKLTTNLAKSQLKTNRRRTIWTLLGIVLSTTMITTVYGLVASSFALVETIWEGAALRAEYEAMLAGLGIILSVVIIISSIVVLSNAFRVSAKERTMQFGILKSVGATKKQIQETVVSESLLLAAVGIPMGIVLGLLIQLFGVTLINHFLLDLFQSARPGEDMGVRFVLSWQAMLLSIALAFATVLLSAWLPARKAAKIPAIDAIRSAGEVKVKKVRKSWLVGKVFGVEGTLAARSLRRSRRNFRATVVALSFSVALFITLGAFVSQMNQLTELTFVDVDANVVIRYHTNMSRVEDGAGGYYMEYTTVSPDLAETISRRFEAYTGTIPFGIGIDGWTYRVELPTEILSSEALEYLGGIGGDITADEQWFAVTLMTLDPVHYAMLAERAGVPLGSNILINHNRMHTPDGRRWEFEPLRFSGQTLELIPYEGGDTVRKLPLHAAIGMGEVPNEILYAGIQTVTVIVPELHAMHYIWNVTAEDPAAFFDYAWDVMTETDLREGGNWHVFNRQDEQEFISALIGLITTFVWGFVALLTLIYLTNIISTISANVQSRAQEFAVLQSVGMTYRGLGRMLGLESILSSVKSLFVGVPLGIAGAYFVHLAIRAAAQFAFQLPWGAIALSVVAVFALTWIVMHHAATRLRNRNIVDTIRAGSGV
ncbi:MAG: ABC transporter permease [Oscillospiraceae bacterium]|nr:ABC transporter permease [Oscillospiraceae bacterium]